MLLVGHADLRLGRSRRTRRADVPDHADDGHELARVEAALDAPADRILGAERRARQRLVDDGDERRVPAYRRRRSHGRA